LAGVAGEFGGGNNKYYLDVVAGFGGAGRGDGRQGGLGKPEGGGKQKIENDALGTENCQGSFGP